MIQVLLLICPINLSPSDCTAVTAERFKISEQRIGVVECLMGSEIMVAAKADNRLEASYLKIVCDEKSNAGDRGRQRPSSYMFQNPVRASAER